MNCDHLYVHVPYCSGRCSYCSFYTRVERLDPERYIDTLRQEIAHRQVDLHSLKTIYMGGGTPGLLGVEGFEALERAHLWMPRPDCEWTVELHPTSVTPQLMSCLASIGVNRISIGMQSLDDTTLTRCNRRHTVKQAIDAFKCAKSFIKDTGLDLIAALPGVTMESWNATIDAALDLAPTHVSVYNLSIEPGCAWYGKVAVSSDEVSCDAVLLAARKLAAAGFTRYETSNYALSRSLRCQHNLNTWHGGDYVGLGDGAVSRVGQERISREGVEKLSPLADAAERALTQLRLNEGFEVASLINRFPILEPYAAIWQHKVTGYQTMNLLDDHFAPTARGYEVLDAMTRELWESLSIEEV